MFPQIIPRVILRVTPRLSSRASRSEPFPTAPTTTAPLTATVMAAHLSPPGGVPTRLRRLPREDSPHRGSGWKRTVTVVPALTAALLLAACSGNAPTAPSETNPGGENAPAKIVFDAANATPNAMAAPYTTVPEQLGFWQDQGLEVEVAYSDGSTAAIQKLLGGRADVVSTGVNAVYSSAVQEPDLRIISLVPKNVWRITVPENSDISTIADLKGKTIGVPALTAGGYSYGRSIVQSDGLDPDADVTWLPAGSGSQAAEALESGRIDAYSSYDGPMEVVAALTEQGLRPLASPLDEIAGSLSIVTLKQVIEERPDDLIRFLRGTYRGLAFTREHPEAAVQIHWQQYPDQEPTGVSKEQAIADTVDSTAKNWENRTSVGDDNLRGFLTTAKVAEAAEFFMTYKIVEGNADPELTVDLSLVKAANEFDEDAVKKQAQQWKP